MSVTALHRQLEPCLQAFAVRPTNVRHGGRLIEPVCRAKWNLAVLSEMAEPGRMVLIPIFDREGRVGDFMWRCASPTVTLLLGCAGEDLSGRTLTQVLGSGAVRDAMFETCHRAFLDRTPQTVAWKSDDWRGSFDARPASAGLIAVLTSASALDRVFAAQLVLRRLEGLLEIRSTATAIPV